MALPDSFKMASGTNIVFRNTGGQAAISYASLANAAAPATSGGARQSVKYDFGALRNEVFDVYMSCEMAATPTSGAVIDVYLNPSSSNTAGTDNLGNCSGTDAAYTGYTNDIEVGIRQLIPIGAMVLSAYATANIQAGYVGSVSVPKRYGSIVVVNRGGSAFHSTETNQFITFVPRIISIEE